MFQACWSIGNKKGVFGEFSGQVKKGAVLGVIF